MRTDISVCGGGGGGGRGSGVFLLTFFVSDGNGMFRGGFLAGGGWYLQVG